MTTDTPVPDLAAVDAAAARLRRGASVVMAEDDGLLYEAAAAEAASPETLARLLALPACILILTHARARTLKMRLYTPDFVALALQPDFSMERLRALADPSADLNHPLSGPYQTLRAPLPQCAAGAIKLAKLAELLPAMVLAPAPAAASAHLRALDATGYDEALALALRVVAQARVPLAGAPETDVVAFRAASGGPEHLALLIAGEDGRPPAPPGPVLVRLHSACLTGDVLGSLKCDCGEQLRGAILAIRDSGGGVLLYLAQEGRGIGLINKLRAYQLQQQGFDTVDANLRLGFEPDERDFRAAARMLALLGFTAIRLLSNNPDKAAQLTRFGIAVDGLVPHRFAPNPHNESYLETKKSRSGHLL